MTGWRNPKVGRRLCIQCHDKRTQSQGKFGLVMIETAWQFYPFSLRSELSPLRLQLQHSPVDVVDLRTPGAPPTVSRPGLQRAL